MNKKIKQHAHEAEKYADANFKGEPFWSEAYESKFAELIVRECAEIVDDKIEVSRYVHEAELLRECSTTIKLHFGVEE